MTLRKAAIAALLFSIVVGMASNVLFLVAFQFRIDWFLEPTRLLGAGARSAELFRWAAVLDLFGYYLSTAVLAYALGRALRPRNEMLADLGTVAAIGYALIGGAGAAVLANVAPMLMHEYAGTASATQRSIIEAQFALLFVVVWRSIWQFIDGLLIGAWWLTIGLLVRDHVGFSRLSLVLAAMAGIFSVLNALGVGLGRDVALGAAFTLWTVWWVWLLVILMRAHEPFSGATQPRRR